MARTEDRSTSRALRTWRERLFDAAPEGQDELLYPSMYRGRLWTMRQFAGFGSAEDTNARFRVAVDSLADMEALFA